MSRIYCWIAATIKARRTRHSINGPIGTGSTRLLRPSRREVGGIRVGKSLTRSTSAAVVSSVRWSVVLRRWLLLLLLLIGR